MGGSERCERPFGARSSERRPNTDAYFSPLPRLATPWAGSLRGAFNPGSVGPLAWMDNQPLPKADCIALGDVVCKHHQSRRDDLESQTIDLGRLNSKGRAHRVAGLLRQQSDNLAAEAQDLQALQPPPADVGTVGSVLALVRAKADLIDNWAKA
jgi:hypothetical protein